MCARVRVLLVMSHSRAGGWLLIPARLLGPCPPGTPVGKDPSSSQHHVPEGLSLCFMNPPAFSGAHVHLAWAVSATRLCLLSLR